MSLSLNSLFEQIKRMLGLPSSVDFRVKDNFGFAINRRTKVRPVQLRAYIDSVNVGEVRVATLLTEIERRIGAHVGAKIEMWHAGRRVDGRRGLASLV